jgi:hypothetical protein
MFSDFRIVHEVLENASLPGKFLDKMRLFQQNLRVSLFLKPPAHSKRFHKCMITNKALAKSFSLEAKRKHYMQKNIVFQKNF